MSHFKIIRDAIARSISHNEIVTLDKQALQGCTAAAARLALFAESEGDAEDKSRGVHEFWGEDADDNEWRVHVKHFDAPEENEHR